MSFLKRRRDRLDEAPHPWRRLPTIAVGGLAAVGFSGDSLAMLVVSTGGGRSLYDVRGGDRIGRDRDPDLKRWLSTSGTSARGIGDYANEDFDLSGLWGGDLARSAGEWRCDIRDSDPRCVNLRGSETRSFTIANEAVVELRTVGFSSDGMTLAIATSAELLLWTLTA